MLLIPTYGVDTGNFFDYIFDYLPKLYRDMKELFCVLLWRIWFSRNSSAFCSTSVDMFDQIGWSKKFLDDYHFANIGSHGEINGKNQGREGLLSCRSPLDINVYKTNCGVAIDSRSGHVGVGIIVRNFACEVMACCSQKIVANLNNKSANLVAIQRSIQFCIDYGLSPCLIESDDDSGANWINHGMYRASKFRVILLDIDAMVAATSCISVSSITVKANNAALRLAKKALLIVDDNFWMEDYPACISSIIEAEMPG
ncbi:hypothetical protein Ddye_001595 [Dipteronia dyeriana]|uniref:RNase H type-1 domain-containing protein n=1 Tax=Dipteronia dyeriana TaxID=168575 RepID=A0AAD9XPD4_9ROSI|nr:hypothetical protein Ddye_001595 [Dipteronia dyeriana]